MVDSVLREKAEEILSSKLYAGSKNFLGERGGGQVGYKYELQPKQITDVPSL